MRKNAKYIKYIILSLLSFCFVVNVSAEECSYEKQVELNNIASTVKATYEEVEIDTGETTYYVNPETDEVDINKEVSVTQKGFDIKILNITDDLYITITNQNTGDSKDYYYSNSNSGTISLGVINAQEITTYSIKISAYRNCSGQELRTINLVIPKYNEYSELAFCNENPDFQYCQKYVTSEDYDITFEQFYKAMEKYKEENPLKEEIVKKEDKDKFKEFFEKNKKVLIIAIAILIVGGTTTVIIVIRRRSRLI